MGASGDRLRVTPLALRRARPRVTSDEGARGPGDAGEQEVVEGSQGLRWAAVFRVTRVGAPKQGGPQKNARKMYFPEGLGAGPPPPKIPRGQVQVGFGF